MQTSLIINSTTATDGKAMSTITDVNADAPGTVCREFGRQLNALTTNNLVSVNRVDKENLDAAEKVTPTITFSPATVTRADVVSATASAGYYTVNITYNGDGKLSVSDAKPSMGGPLNVRNVAAKIFGNTLRIYAYVANANGIDTNADFPFEVKASATESYNAVSATFTVTKN